MNKEEYIKTNLKDVLRFCGAQSIISSFKIQGTKVSLTIPYSINIRGQ